ncbi:IclR family transcriptional regulator [Nocardia sp. NPDC003482]
MAGENGGEPVLDRAFRILEAFTAAEERLTLTSLSARSGLPKSTALRLATRLVELGALERTPDGQYVIGLRLYEIGAMAPRSQRLRRIALPYLEDLHLATGQHVLLAVRDGYEAVLIDRLSAHDAGRVMFRVGGRMPLHATGVGLALLANAPAAVQEAILRGELRLEPEHDTLSPEDLRRTLARVRKDGIAVMSRPYPEPMTSVAAPVFGARSVVVAALSAVAPTGRVEPAALRPAVIAISRAVSRQLTSANAGKGWSD